MIITSKDNKIVKYVRKLSQKKYRDEYGCFIVEGVRAVGDVLGYPGAETETVVVSESRCGDYPGAVVVSDEVFASMCETENGQGVLSVVRIPEPSPVTCDNVLFLDGVRDPGNLGTLIRRGLSRRMSPRMRRSVFRQGRQKHDVRRNQGKSCSVRYRDAARAEKCRLYDIRG